MNQVYNTVNAGNLISAPENNDFIDTTNEQTISGNILSNMCSTPMALNLQNSDQSTGAVAAEEATTETMPIRTIVLSDSDSDIEILEWASDANAKPMIKSEMEWN